MRVPLFVNLADRLVLVVGGGDVALRKATELTEAGARVRVVAPDIGEPFDALGVAKEQRGFVASDVDDAWLVIAATDVDEVQDAVVAACEAKKTWCLAVDDVKRTRIFGAAVVHRPPFTVAISTDGQAPALARLLREMFDAFLPANDWVALATELRNRWKRENVPMGERFPQLLAEFAARRNR